MKRFFFGSSILIILITACQCVNAGVAYPDPPGGWTYTLGGDAAVCGSPGAAFTSLDGTWQRGNGSSEWDCSAIGGVIASGINNPGGVMTMNNGSNPAETNVTYLRIQDPGNPPAFSLLANNGCSGCTITNPANRKLLFVHNMTAEGCPDTVLDDGFTISFRARIPTPAKTSAPLDPIYPNGETAGGPQPYPADGDGVLLADNANGCVSARQLANGKIGFSLVTSNDTLGGFTTTPKANFRGFQINGLIGNALNNNIDFTEAPVQFIPLDPTDWNEFWIVVKKDNSGLGTHLVLVYTNGSSAAQIFHVTAAAATGEGTHSHIEMGSSQTAQSGAVDIDFLSYKFEAVYPPGAGGPPPTISDVVPTPPAAGNVFWPATNGVAFTASTSSSTIQPAGIILILNGSNVSTGLSIGGDATNRTVTYAGLANNTIYTGQIQVTDAGGATAVFPLRFDTFTTASSLVIDAEDYNYDGGVFLDNSAPNGYATFSGVTEVDFHEVTPLTYGDYRTGDTVDTRLSTDSTRQSFTDVGAIDFQISVIEQGEWLNYTRTFPAGKYNVYLRYSGTLAQSVRLDLITGNRALSNQTTAALGSFPVANSGYAYSRLSDAAGVPLVLNLSGLQTLRMTAPSASLNLNLNYLVFAPLVGAVTNPPVIGFASPATNAADFLPDAPIRIGIVNRDTAALTNTINFRLDGNDVTSSATISSNAAGASITYQPPVQLVLNSRHTNRVVFTDNGTPARTFTNQWPFTVANLPVLLAGWATPPGSGLTNGFNNKVHQHIGAQSLLFPNTAARGEDQVGLLLIDTTTGQPFSNDAPGPEGDGSYPETGVINYSNDATDRGSFPGDQPFPNLGPGLPEHLAMSVTAYLDLPAGLHRFGVRRNDGFKLSAGPNFTRAGASLALGIFETPNNDNGSGATEFDFMVPASGVYPFRLIFVQNTGPSDLEWYSVNRTNGVTTLINTNDAASVKAYMARTVPPIGIVQILNPQLSGTNLTFSYATVAAHTYYVDYRDTIAGPWVLQPDPGIAGDGTTKNFSAPVNNPATRFYRIRAQ